MFSYKSAVFWLGVLTVTVTLAACSGQAPRAVATGATLLSTASPESSLQAGMEEALPAPSGLPSRTASGTYVIDPSLPLLWSPGETPADPFLMVAPAKEYRYAVYQAGPVNNLSRPTGFVFNLDGSVGTVWLGLANYTRDSWEWFPIEGPFSTWMEFSVPGDGSAYFSTADHLSFCLLAYDGDTLNFAGAHLQTSNHPYLDPASWVTYNLTAGINYGKHSAACLIDNKPAVVYTKDDSKDIYFALAANALPSSAGDWASHKLATTGDLGGSVDIAVSNGVPCVTYEDTVKQDIFFAAANTAEPSDTSNWTSYSPDTSGQSAVRIVDYEGIPMLLYLCSSGLRFSRAISAGIPTDSAGWLTVGVATGDFYEYPQLATIAGGPILAYQLKQGGYNTLMFAWSDSIEDALILPGTSWTTCLVDDADPNSGNKVCLATDASGKAWIAYTNIDIVQFMKLAMADTTMPTAQADFTTVTVYGKEQTHTGQYMSMAPVQGRPLMSFIETGSGSVAGLHMAYPNREVEEIGGPEAFDLAILDPADGYFINEDTTTLTLQDGRPAVIYRTSEGLKYAYFNGVWP
jgi:hypothetical protein